MDEDAGTPLGAGIGGRTIRLDIGGVPVFVKRVPLTDLEQRPEYAHSTANLFALPTCYQYGVGSTGFGAWRELATHRTTTQWVLDGVSDQFPLLHHWRATAGVVLFLEHLPWTLHDWLTERFDAGDGERAVLLADRQLHAVTAVLRRHGLVHFDAHPGNVLTDGRRLYLADFGLTLDRAFALSPAETAFLDLHRDWDRWDTERYLVNWLCRRLAPAADRTAVISSGGPGLPGYAAALISRYGPTVLLLNDFYDRLVAGPKSTPYPAAELLRAGRARTPAGSPPRR